MPPSWTFKCAFESLRSVPARCSAAPVSGNSTKAWIEMRGTGRSCGLAPKASGSGTCSVVIAGCLLLDFGALAGLLHSLVAGALVGLRDLALLVVTHDGIASGRIGRAQRARFDEIARIGDHGGDIVLHGAAEIRRGLVVRRVLPILRPVAARRAILDMRLVGDVADLDLAVVALAARAHQDAVARNAEP